MKEYSRLASISKCVRHFYSDFLDDPFFVEERSALREDPDPSLVRLYGELASARPPLRVEDVRT